MRKKIIGLFCLICISNLISAQAQKWSVSVSSGYLIGGPGVAIKNKMIKQKFDQTSTFNFFGLVLNTDYPISTKSPSLLLRIAIKKSERKSYLFYGGITANGTVSGYKRDGYDDLLGLFGGSYGTTIGIDYKIFQLGAGYQYSYSMSRIKFSLAPSIFFLSYQDKNLLKSYKGLSIVPGASFSARVPLGKEKKLFGVDLVVDANIAPPAKMKEYNVAGSTNFKPGAVNMLTCNIGIAFSFRK